MTNEQQDIPIVFATKDSIIIEIPIDRFILAIEGRTDGKYRVIDRSQFIKDCVKQLNCYQESNAVALGLTELQYLLDRVTDKVVENCDSIDYEDC